MPPSEPATFDEAVQFIQDIWSDAGVASEMHIGDLCWAVWHPSPPGLESLTLWRDSSGTVQALTLGHVGGVWDLVVRPGSGGLDAASEALDALEDLHRIRLSELGDSTTLRVGRRVQNSDVRSLFERRGFTQLSNGFPAMSRRLDTYDPVPSPLPAGYVVRALRDDEILARIRVFAEAFPDDELTVDAYDSLRACGPYVPDLDIVVIAPDAAIAAFATLWLDRANQVVQIEPAGCREGHRRLGLTSAAIRFGLDAAARWGARHALVRAYSGNLAARGLYEACGFRVSSGHFGYSKTWQAGG